MVLTKNFDLKYSPKDYFEEFSHKRGQYLPDYDRDEVEICRVVLDSATTDIYSMRAKKTDSGILYRVVDEYGDCNFILPFAESINPLSMNQLIENLDSCKLVLKDTGEANDQYGDGLIRPSINYMVEISSTSNYDKEEISDFVTVESSDYPDLQEYYEYKKMIWIEELMQSEDK
ncbi:hypothetical protein OA340_01035 [Paracoccaceae bacterium]|nr:hypothetical protein [Paracoccaceae bacterium]